jgi:hypothetical protein
MFTSYSRFHGVIAHLLFVQFFLFIVSLDLFKPRFKDMYWVLLLHVVLLFLSLGMSHAFNTNFANMLRPTGFLRNFEDSISQPVIVVIVFVGILIGDLIGYFLVAKPYGWLRRRKEKSPSHEELIHKLQDD